MGKVIEILPMHICYGIGLRAIRGSLKSVQTLASTSFQEEPETLMLFFSNLNSTAGTGQFGHVMQSTAKA